MNEKFSDIARRLFYFLEEAGFHCLQPEPTLLRYETENVFVTITWDPRSGEIGEFIGLRSRKGEREDGFSLSDLLAMEGVDLPERKMPFQVSDESRLGPFLEKLAEDTSTFARSALAGDRMYLRRLKTFRNAAAQTYMRSLTLQNVRSHAEIAWHRREFDRVVDLYTSIEDDLSGSERGKLEYTKKTLAKRREQDEADSGSAGPPSVSIHLQIASRALRTAESAPGKMWVIARETFLILQPGTMPWGSIWGYTVWTAYPIR